MKDGYIVPQPEDLHESVLQIFPEFEFARDDGNRSPNWLGL